MENVMEEQERVIKIRDEKKKKRKRPVSELAYYKEARNYVQTKDAAEMLSMSETEMIRLAKELGAYLKIHSMNYCRIDIILENFEEARKQETSYNRSSY